ncbi:MAG TPA: hypothetical protein VHA76_12780 [Solirubrobacterales bacterium]|nr:hypothetical protein [Solirubrobacterales bacterium]
MASWGEIGSVAPDLARHGAAEVPVDESTLYRADVREVAVARLTTAGDELAIDFWSEAGGVRSPTRR